MYNFSMLKSGGQLLTLLRRISQKAVRHNLQSKCHGLRRTRTRTCGGDAERAANLFDELNQGQQKKILRKEITGEKYADDK